MDLIDLRILDLCAGTGNISIEFLSREAGTVTAVDNNYHAYKHIGKLANDLGCEDEIAVIKSDVLKFLNQTQTQYDIIFADPPYAYDKHLEIANLVFEKGILSDNGLLVIEHGRETTMESHSHFIFSRKYGNVHFSFFQNK